MHLKSKGIMKTQNQSFKNNKMTSMKRTVNHLLLAFLLSMTAIISSCSKDDDNNHSDTTIETVLTDIDFQGFAIITNNGNDLVRKGFGLANQSTALPQDINLGYRVASVTKTLTAAAVVQLKRDGLLNSFNQTLDEFDPEFPNGNQITITQLLSHQSGIPDYQFIVEDAYEDGETLDEEEIYEVIKEMITENGLNFSPGSSKEYSNSNFLIAALLVQELSQLSYHEYIQQKIFTPLDMMDTYKGNDVIDANTHAEGYKDGSVNSTYPMAIGFGVGDISSTPKDMETWIKAVKADWFTEAEKAEIFAQDVPSGFVDFGLGWFTTQEGNTTMYWHGGDINGYWSMIGFVPKYAATIVLLSNRQDDSGQQRNTIIERLLTTEFK